jgi:ketosteroid isomerase-like protein
MIEQTAIEAFFKSYAKATADGDVDAMVRHYAEPYTAFALGQTFTYPTRAAAKASTAPHIAKLQANGISDFRVLDVQYNIISDTYVMTFPLWEVRPRDRDPWHMRLVYGLRLHPEGLLAELAVADNEAKNILALYPHLFQAA